MGILGKLFGRVPLARPQIHDPSLGLLVYNTTERLWQASVDFDGRLIYLSIEGDQFPEPLLVEEARKIAAAAPGFRARLADFLERESDARFSSVAHHEMYQNEIDALELDQLLFLFPDKPYSISASLTGGSLGHWSVDMEDDRFLCLIGPE